MWAYRDRLGDYDMGHGTQRRGPSHKPRTVCRRVSTPRHRAALQQTAAKPSNCISQQATALHALATGSRVCVIGSDKQRTEAFAALTALITQLRISFSRPLVPGQRAPDLVLFDSDVRRTSGAAFLRSRIQPVTLIQNENRRANVCRVWRVSF